MGSSCNCVKDTCNKDTFLFTKEINPLSNRPEETERFQNNINNSFMEDPQYQKLSREFFDIFNDIRVNPDKHIAQSKEHSLLQIFIKQKPCKEITFIEDDIIEIKKYLINSHFMNKSIMEQEEELKNVITDENIKDISLFQTICSNNDMNENVWTFLLENEDDLEKIFSDEYNKLIIVCFPLEFNSKILTSLIFYNN